MSTYRLEEDEGLASWFVTIHAEGGYSMFSDNYPQLSLEKDGIPIHVVEMGDRLIVMLEICNEAIHDKIRVAVKEALEWRDRINNLQGPAIDTAELPFLERLHRRHREGESYADLAKWINRRLSNDLCNHEEPAGQSKIGRRQDNAPPPLDDIEKMLTLLRFSEETIENYIQDGLSLIQQGIPPFDHGNEYPVTRNKIIYLLRSWRESIEHFYLSDHSGSVEEDDLPEELLL